MMQINILDYLKLLVKYRKLLLCNLFIIIAISIVLSLIWPYKYKAVAKFIPSYNVQTPFSELRNVGTPDLFWMLGGGVFVSDIYVGILQSRTLMEDVVNKTGLMQVFKRRRIEDAIEDLEKSSSIVITDEQAITVTVFMPDPELAALVANTWVNSLDLRSQAIISEQGSRHVLFLRDRLLDLARQLDSLSDSLAVFESKHRVFSMNEETKAAVDVYAELAVQLLQREIELMKWKDAGTDLPIRRSIELEIENLQKKLEEIENNWTGGIIANAPLSKLPSLQLEHASMSRKKAVLDSLSSYLLLEYEIANLKALSNTPTLIVIDEAIPPEKRTWPARAKIVLISTLFAVLSNMMLVLALENRKLRWSV